ncbi:tRNA (cytidine(34)-2'-O)-methyltransferase [Planctomycetaceae bacterium SH139]
MENSKSEKMRRDKETGKLADSLARDASSPQADQVPIVIDQPGPASPLAHVVLYQPEIPQNTGNIGRSCVATGASLWIVRPAAFQFDARAVRRAGLDYWQHLDFHAVDDWQALQQELPPQPPRQYWYFSRFATRSIWSVEFQRGDVLVFGSETSGLPATMREQAGPQALRLPTTPLVRSLNLANTVAVALYEVVRQCCRQPVTDA